MTASKWGAAALARGVSEFEHRFGGQRLHGFPLLAPSFQPHLLLTIDTRDPALACSASASEEALVALYYPMRVDGVEMTYALEGGTGNVLTLSSSTGDCGGDWPYESYPSEFPPFTLEASRVDAAELHEDLRCRWVDWKAPRPQIEPPRILFGGNPHFCLQDDSTRQCPRCWADMSPFASILEECGDPFQLWSRDDEAGPLIQILWFLCTECSAITTVNHCD